MRMFVVVVVNRLQFFESQFNNFDFILKSFINVLCFNQQIITRINFLIRSTKILTCLTIKYFSSSTKWNFNCYFDYFYQFFFRSICRFFLFQLFETKNYVNWNPQKKRKTILINNNQNKFFVMFSLRVRISKQFDTLTSNFC